MQQRGEAVTWAEGVVHKLQIEEIDRPYLVAVLVEAALLEDPVRPLNIAVNPDGTRYLITIKGYQTMIDAEELVYTFRGAERHHHLTRVQNVFIQFPPDEGAYLVIAMDSGQWQETKTVAAARRHMPRRRVE